MSNINFPNISSFPQFESSFSNSPFGEFWETAIQNEEEVYSKNNINIRVAVSENINTVKNKFENELTSSNTIKLYISVKNQKVINYSKTQDLRTANIRFSNIIKIYGIVLGDEVYDLFKEKPSKIEFYAEKLALDFVDDTITVEKIKTQLILHFNHYIENPRSDTFKLGLVGRLIQQELQKSLQEFWKPILQALAKEVRGFKIEDEKYWQPYTQEGELKTGNNFTPLISFGNNPSAVYDSYVATFSKIELTIEEYLNLKGINANIPSEKKTFITEGLHLIYDLLKIGVTAFKGVFLDFLEANLERAYEINALLVGLFNGVLELIAGLVDFIALFAGLLSGDAEEFLQAFNDKYEELKQEGILKFLYEQITQFFNAIANRYDSEQGKYQILKNLGEDLIEIILVFLGTAHTIKTAQKLIKEFKDKIDDLFKRRKKDIEEIKESKIIRQNLIKDVPGIKNFNKWFDELSVEEFDIVWKNEKLKNKVKSRIRHPGGLHEWLMVSRANVFKNWGITANKIKILRTEIDKVIFKNPPGYHGGPGSTKAHNEILDLIDTSESYDEFKNKLINWSEKRLNGGKESLPKEFFN